MDWDRLEIYLLVGGALIAAAGKALGMPIVVSVGVGIIALAVALIGLEGIVTRKAKWGITPYYSETYQGVAGVALGLIFLAAGVAFGALVVAQAFHQEQSLLELIFSRPGFILLPVGGIMFLRGLADVIGAVEWQNSGLARVGTALQRLAGAVLALLGAIGLALGGIEILAPAVFRSMTTAAWQAFLAMLGLP